MRFVVTSFQFLLVQLWEVGAGIAVRAYSVDHYATVMMRRPQRHWFSIWFRFDWGLVRKCVLCNGALDNLKVFLTRTAFGSKVLHCFGVQSKAEFPKAFDKLMSIGACVACEVLVKVVRRYLRSKLFMAQSTVEFAVDTYAIMFLCIISVYNEWRGFTPTLVRFHGPRRQYSWCTPFVLVSLGGRTSLPLMCFWRRLKVM